MDEFEEKLNKSFEIKEQVKDLVVKSKEIAPIVTQDAISVKRDLRDIIEEGTEALKDLAATAKDTSSDKHYTALAALIKSLTDAAKASVEVELIAAQTNKLNSEMIDRVPNKLQQNNQTNVFVGSTKEAIDMLKTLPEGSK